VGGDAEVYETIDEFDFLADSCNGNHDNRSFRKKDIIFLIGSRLSWLSSFLNLNKAVTVRLS
jgi:hypothetical protein